MFDWLSGIHIQHPGWLWALPLSLTAVGLLLHGRRLGSLARLPEWIGVRRFRHPRADILRQLYTQQARQAAGRLWLRWSHYALVLLCVHVALAQPYRLGQQLPAPPEYRDTLFLIDTSVSMVLRDYLVAGERTPRMTILKSVLTHFIDQLKGNRIGLVVFSEQPYTLVPLTADYHLLKSRVRRLQPAVLTGRTSDLGRALLYTTAQLQRADAAEQSAKPVLVLVTDVNRSSRDVDPRSVAAYLRRQGYHLHTVGIGAGSYEAREQGAGGLVYHPASFTLLEAIAEQGGGNFYRANNAGSLQAAIAAIQSAERRQVRAEPRHVTLPLYQWPLLLAVVLLLVSQSVSGRGRYR